MREVNPPRRRDRLGISALGLAGVLSLCLSGCGSAETRPQDPSKEAPPPPPIASASVAPPTDPLWNTDRLLSEVQTLLADRQRRLALAGGAALFVLVLVGIGVAKILRGSAPRTDPALASSGGPASSELDPPSELEHRT